MQLYYIKTQGSLAILCVGSRKYISVRSKWPTRNHTSLIMTCQCAEHIRLDSYCIDLPHDIIYYIIYQLMLVYLVTQSYLTEVMHGSMYSGN